MASHRGGTPRGTGIPSLEASNQSQIDDLVQRNRTLEHTIKKLSDELTLEATRSKEAVIDIQKKWHEEQLGWREGCDVLQSCHRIVQLRTAVELEKERMNVLKELDAERREKLKRLQRDFRITMFQVKETELERRISELEDEQELVVAGYEERTKRLKDKCTEYAARVTGKDDELAVAQQEREDFEERLAKLREEQAHLRVSAESTTSKLERVTLQLEGAETRNADLERTNDELKRHSIDIKRQLDKWQSLETKGVVEVEMLRKRRIELEIQVKELETRLDKTKEEGARALEKERRKVQKFRTGNEEAQARSDILKQECNETKQQLAKAHKQLEKLKHELEGERARANLPSPTKKRIPQKQTPDASEDEVANEVEASPPRRALPPRVKLATTIKSRKRASTASNSGISESNDEAGPSDTNTNDIRVEQNIVKSKGKSNATDSGTKVVPRRTGRTRKATPPQADTERIRPQPTGKRTGKAKAVDQDENDEEPEQPPDRNKGKRKARTTDEESSGEVRGSQATAVRSKRDANARKRADGEEGTDSVPRQRKAGSRTGSVKPGTVREPEGQPYVTEDHLPPKKKKRKINIFATNAEPTAFNFISQVDGGGLNIPTVLSPIKESEGIPSRSTSGSIAGGIGSMLRHSFTRRT